MQPDLSSSVCSSFSVLTALMWNETFGIYVGMKWCKKKEPLVDGAMITLGMVTDGYVVKTIWRQVIIELLHEKTCNEQEKKAWGRIIQ